MEGMGESTWDLIAQMDWIQGPQDFSEHNSSSHERGRPLLLKLGTGINKNLNCTRGGSESAPITWSVLATIIFF